MATLQIDFYREFLMGRSSFDPKDFGVDMEQVDFIDLCCEQFNATYRGQWTIDELLLHPRDALRFCDDFRHHHKFLDVPDDIILRSIMMRRKNPNA